MPPDCSLRKTTATSPGWSSPVNGSYVVVVPSVRMILVDWATSSETPSYSASIFAGISQLFARTAA